MPFLALRVTCDSGQMTWSVFEGVLTLTPVGGSASPLTLDLSGFTVLGLANYLASQPGYLVPFQTDTPYGSKSALILLNGSGDVSLSNGDHLFGFTNILYAYLNATGTEVNAAQAQIVNAVAQMSTTTAAAEFLDFLGTYYNVPRNSGELDPAYGPRIISSVLLPSANNIGMANAIQARYPNTVARVDDAVTNAGSLVIRDGSIKFNSLFVHNSNVLAISGGLFDLTLAFAFSGPISVTDYPALLIAAMNSYRAGGTYLRNLILKDGTSASVIINSFNIGPILVIVYGQNQTLEDTSSISWFEDDEDTEEFTLEPYQSLAVQSNAVGRTPDDAFDWSDETVDQDELIFDYITSAVGVSASLPLMADAIDWTEEEPDNIDDIDMASQPVGATAVLNPVEDAIDWSAEEPDEDDRMSAMNTDPVGASAPSMPVMEDGFDQFNDDGDEFYANHFTNINAPEMAQLDPWPWMDEDEEMVLIVSGYLNSDASPSGAALFSEGNVQLVTEGGVAITTET